MATVLIYMLMHHTLQFIALSHLLQVHLILTLVKNTVYGPGHSASILGQTECLMIYSNDKI